MILQRAAPHAAIPNHKAGKDFVVSPSPALLFFCPISFALDGP